MEAGNPDIWKWFLEVPQELQRNKCRQSTNYICFTLWFKVLAFLSSTWNLRYYRLSINCKLDQSDWYMFTKWLLGAGSDVQTKWFLGPLPPIHWLEDMQTGESEIAMVIFEAVMSYWKTKLWASPKNYLMSFRFLKSLKYHSAQSSCLLFRCYFGH